MKTSLDQFLQAKRDHYASLVAKAEPGPERIWAHRNLALLDGGFYTSDELIDLSTSNGFSIFDPFTRIRRGTTIEQAVIVGPGCSILGEDVTIGLGTTLDRAILSGDHMKIGRNNRLKGDIEVGRLSVGDDNVIVGLSGDNEGEVSLGNCNKLTNVRIANKGSSCISIGNHNDLWPGLNINNPFPGGRISIGHHNSLGRDGGGVISSSYRFGRGWVGEVFLGFGVETTRGAEILGFSVLGWPRDLLSSIWQIDEAGLVRLIKDGSLSELSIYFDRLREIDVTLFGDHIDERRAISLFGATKVKRTIMTGRVTAKDDTRTLCAYLRDVAVQERSKIYYAAIAPADEVIISISTQDCALEHVEITEHQNWEDLPKSLKTDEYPPSDADYYADSSR